MTPLSSGRGLLPVHPDPPDPSLVRRARERLLARIDRLEEEPGEQPPTPAEIGEDAPEVRYVIGEVIAVGGLGVIRAADDRRLGRPVALKLLRERTPEAEQRLLAEAAIIARLEHPSIIPVHDVGRFASGEPFYCMKLVEGGSLGAAIAARPHLGERLSLVERVLATADAIAHAHRQGILHRDIKPANVLIGAHGETVVIDWGLAKDIRKPAVAPTRDRAPRERDDAAATESGTIVGTLRYMAPEQARGEDIDARSDVFALGGLLFQVLAGVPPYPDLERADLVSRVVAGEHDDPSMHAKDVPVELAAIVARAMAPRPADRYDDAAAFAADLRRFLTGHLVDAHRYRASEVLGRWLRRHRGSVAVATAAFVALLALGVLFIHRLDAEAARARTAEVAALERADAAVLAHARMTLDDDPMEALALLDGPLERPSNHRLARLIAIAALGRGAPDQVLRGPSRPIRRLAALSAGGVVALDDAGAVWRWGEANGRGEHLFDLGTPDGVIVTAADAPVWVALGRGRGHVVRGDAAPESIEIGAVDASRPFLSRGGDVLLLLERESSGPTSSPSVAHVWDLQARPPRPRTLATRASAALAPDGSQVAVVPPDGGGVLVDGEGSLRIPEMAAPRLFSTAGDVLVGRRRGAPGTIEDLAHVLTDGTQIRLGGSVLALVDDRFALVHELDPGPLPLVHSYRLALRALATGEDRWVRPLRDLSLRTFDHAVATGGGGLSVDPRSQRFALHIDGRWRVHSLIDGDLERILPRADAFGVFLADGRFAAPHGDTVWLWDLAQHSVEPSMTGHALASDASHTVVRSEPEADLHLRGPDGSTRVLGCPSGHGHESPRVAVDRRGRVLVAAGRYGLCLSTPGAEAIEVPVEGHVQSIALADASEALGVGLRDGVIVLWSEAAAAPQRWRLAAPIDGLWLAYDARVAYALAGGQIVALRPGQPTMTPIVDVGTARPREVAVALDPRGGAAAFALGGHDVLVVHRAQDDVVAIHPRTLALPPSLAYAPSGERLALAVPGPAIEVLDPGSAVPLAPAIPLPHAPVGMVFIDDEALASVGDDGSLARIDLTLGLALVVRPEWIPDVDRRRALDSLAGAPDGRVAALRAYNLWSTPPDAVPERAELREWVRARIR